MFKLLRFGVKAGIMTSAVYLTVDYGVWKESDTTDKLYDKFYLEASKQITPLVEMVPISLPTIPRTGSFISTAENTWNLGVLATCKFLAASPTCGGRLILQGYDYIKEQAGNLLEADGSKST